MTTPTSPTPTSTTSTSKGWLPVIPSRYAKAIVNFITTGLGSYLLAASDNHVTTNEWVWIVITMLASTGLVATVTNKP